MWGSSLIALLFSSSRRGPSSGSCTFPPSFQVEVGLGVVPPKILLVMELSPCLITSRKHLALQPSLGRLNNNSLLCPIVPAFFSGEFTTPSIFLGKETGHWA